MTGDGGAQIISHFQSAWPGEPRLSSARGGMEEMGEKQLLSVWPLVVFIVWQSEQSAAGISAPANITDQQEMKSGAEGRPGLAGTEMGTTT